MTRKELIGLYATVTLEIAGLSASQGAARARFQKARAMIDATIHAGMPGDEPDAANCEQIQTHLKTAREFAKNPPAAPKKSGGKSTKGAPKKPKNKAPKPKRTSRKKSAKKKSGKK